MNTTKIEIAPKESEEFTLPSGVVVLVRTAKGRDMHQGLKICGNDTDFLIPALASIICTFNGEQKNMDDILDMDMSDYGPILEKVGTVLAGN